MVDAIVSVTDKKTIWGFGPRKLKHAIIYADFIFQKHSKPEV